MQYEEEDFEYDEDMYDYDDYDDYDYDDYLNELDFYRYDIEDEDR